jgi:hypothetical protein
MYVYKYHFEDDEEWTLYTSAPMPTDTSKLFDNKENLPFFASSDQITETRGADKILEQVLFDTYMRYVRERNGGYYEGYYSRRSDNAYSMYDY